MRDGNSEVKTISLSNERRATNDARGGTVNCHVVVSAEREYGEEKFTGKQDEKNPSEKRDWFGLVREKTGAAEKDTGNDE
jgi:hypothetical protein